jgi:hypothetical protein
LLPRASSPPAALDALAGDFQQGFAGWCGEFHAVDHSIDAKTDTGVLVGDPIAATRGNDFAWRKATMRLQVCRQVRAGGK